MFDAQSCRLINNDLISLRAYEIRISLLSMAMGIIFHPRRVDACETALLSVNRRIVITVTTLSIKQRNNLCYILRRQR